MKAKDRLFFKNRMTVWLKELLAHGDDTIVTLAGYTENLSDPLDQAVFESERSFKLRIRDRESTLIKKIKQSLEDIENGGYGICVICGGEISIQRLRARPVARHCIKCKTEMEKIERLTGS